MWTLGHDESEFIPDSLSEGTGAPLVALGVLCVKWAPGPPRLEGLVCVEGLVSGCWARRER